MAKTKRATETLNLALSAIEQQIRMAIRAVHSEDDVVIGMLNDTLKRCEEARDAMLTIQFHAAQI